MCQSRTAYCNTSIDDLLKIMIVTDSREEYSLSISKALIISLLNSSNGLYVNITEIPKEGNWIDSLINIMVEFKFNQHSGIVSELKPIIKPDLKNERMNKINCLNEILYFCIYI